MSKMKALLQKAKDEVLKIEARSEESISIIETIVYKNKPTSDDITKLNRVLKLLKK